MNVVRGTCVVYIHPHYKLTGQMYMYVRVYGMVSEKLHECIIIIIK